MEPDNEYQVVPDTGLIMEPDIHTVHRLTGLVGCGRSRAGAQRVAPPPNLVDCPEEAEERLAREPACAGVHRGHEAASLASPGCLLGGERTELIGSFCCCAASTRVLD